MSAKNFIVIICLFLCIVPRALAKDRTVSTNLKLIKLKQYNKITDNSVYHEVMGFSKNAPFGDKFGRPTNVHETVHGINSAMRNEFYKLKVNGFYAGGGYGILVSNPKLRLRQIKNYIPDCLRGYRFKLYFEEQLADWDEIPTYPIDEWSAYIAGAECAVDDAKKGIYEKEKADSVSGALEFSIYCTALCIATKNLDNDYWINNYQLKETINYFLIKSEKIFFEGKDLFPSQKQDLLLENLRNNENCHELRNFLETEFNGIFVD